MIAAATFGMIAYLAGNAIFADYLQHQLRAGRRRADGVLRRA